MNVNVACPNRFIFFPCDCGDYKVQIHVRRESCHKECSLDMKRSFTNLDLLNK